MTESNGPNALFFAWWDSADASLLAADVATKLASGALTQSLAAHYHRLIEHVQSHAGSWSADDRSALLKRFDRMHKSKDHHPLYSSHMRMDRTLAGTTGVCDRFALALLESGVGWGGPDADGVENGAASKLLNFELVLGQTPDPLFLRKTLLPAVGRASRRGWTATLARLLNWPNAAERILETPGSLSLLNPNFWVTTGEFSVTEATAWTRLVGSSDPAVIQVWLNAGADPGARDRIGRPLLAYANQPQRIAALLEAGADPLDPAAPLDQRLADLVWLLKGWKTFLAEQLGTPSHKHEGESCAELYLRVRLDQWPPDEQCQAIARLAPWLFDVYADSLRLEDNTSARVWTALLDLLPSPEQMPVGRGWRLEIDGKRLCFPAAMAWLLLTGQRSRERHSHPLDLERQAVADGAGLFDRDVAALWDRVGSPVGEKDPLRGIPAERLPDILFELIAHTPAGTSPLAALGGLDPLLSKARFEKYPALAAALPDLLDAYGDAVWREPSAPALWRKTIAWLGRCEVDAPVARRARWTVMAWASSAEPPLSEADEARAAVILREALAQGWRIWPSDKPLAQAAAALRSQQPRADALFKALVLDETMDEATPPPGGARPRPRM